MARTKSKSSELSSIIDQIEAGLKRLKSFSETVNAALADSDTLAKLAPDLIRLAETINPPEPPEPEPNDTPTRTLDIGELPPPPSPDSKPPHIKRSRKHIADSNNGSSENNKDESEKVDTTDTSPESDEQSDRGSDLES